MSRQREVSEPAFPMPFSTDEHAAPCNTTVMQPGMSLRDYLAAKAMQALIVGRTWEHIKDHDAKPAAWAAGAYIVADAMLAERNKP